MLFCLGTSKSVESEVAWLSSFGLREYPKNRRRWWRVTRSRSQGTLVCLNKQNTYFKFCVYLELLPRIRAEHEIGRWGNFTCHRIHEGSEMFKSQCSMFFFSSGDLRTRMPVSAASIPRLLTATASFTFVKWPFIFGTRSYRRKGYIVSL